MPRLLTFFQVLILAMNVFQLAYFFGGFGWYRIGLPFKAAVSPNPADFILGLSVVLYWAVLLDTSFSIRYQILRPRAVEAWTNIFAVS